jgi:hypothetical protein
VRLPLGIERTQTPQTNATSLDIFEIIFSSVRERACVMRSRGRSGWLWVGKWESQRPGAT